MARTNDPDSATSQFFINLIDNSFLNASPGNQGYAVFGKVTAGMEVVDEIAKVRTGPHPPHSDWPREDVVIKRASMKAA
jgi:peptidyl-prolyl cis-trans isomerase A (cyclophilin A)